MTFRTHFLLLLPILFLSPLLKVDVEQSVKRCNERSATHFPQRLKSHFGPQKPFSSFVAMETSTKRFKCLQKLIGSSKLNTEPSILNSVLLGPSSNHFGTFCQNLQLDLKSSNHPSSARALKFCQAHSVMSTYYVSKVVKYSSFQTYFRTFEYLVHCVITSMCMGYYQSMSSR